MSGDQPPPPGWQPPEPEPQPGWGQTPPPGYQPASWSDYHPSSGDRWSGQSPPPPTGYASVATAAPVAHKPGAIPLRPLVLSDLFDGAFRIIRYNPRATIGAAVLVSAVAMVVPIVIGLATGSTGNLATDAGSDTLTDSQVVSLLVTLGGLFVGRELQAIGLLFVTGMIAHVTAAAAVGRKLTMAEAWAATRGKRWRLLGLSLTLSLGVIVVVGVAFGLVVLAAVGGASVGTVVGLAILLAVTVVVGLLLVWVRVVALSVPALMLEPVGIFGAIRRAVRLSRSQFWRLLGLLLLVYLVVAVAGTIMRLPFSIAGSVFLTGSTGTSSGLLVYLVLTGVGTVISSAVLEPFNAAVSALLYVDQRIRKEAYDVELLGRAGILPS